MSPNEWYWRAATALRDSLDWVRLGIGFDPARGISIPDARRELPFRVTDVQVGEWARPEASPTEKRWLQDLKNQADCIASHRLTLFGLQDRYLGDPIDWNYEHESGVRVPLRFAAWIDYRDRRVVGDAKVCWEPSRHHHLVTLARTYRASGESRYASAALDQLDSWISQSRFGFGINWRSPLELAVRVINWVWTLDLIAESGLFRGGIRQRVTRSVYQHLWEISRKYSRGSSANNHLIGEAAGVFVAASYFPELPETASWRKTSWEILEREILAQTFEDGCTREQALGYHLFVCQFFLFAGLVSQWTHMPFPERYWRRLERMLEFVSALIEGGGSLPFFGDCDDGYVLDLGAGPGEAAWMLAVGGALFDRPELKAGAGDWSEPARWVLRSPCRERFEQLTEPPETLLRSRAFQHSGYYLLQCGHRNTADRMSVLFDCGDLGFGPLAAHGHADALSFTLRAFGVDIFIDPGTYDYFTFPAWRDYFRSTRAHNTVVVDGADQSVMTGPFMWGRRANARPVRWLQEAQGGEIVAEHDGYARLTSPASHRRTLVLSGTARSLTIRDEISTAGKHDLALYFHLSEHCEIISRSANVYTLRAGGRVLTFEVDQQLAVESVQGCDQPLGGWVSRGYHQKTPAATLIARVQHRGNATFVCRITASVAAPTAPLTEAPH
jgi:uncharacterized heparinase superfamily protein